MSTICITMKFAKLFAHALLAVAFVQTGSAVVQSEYEETGRCKVFLVLLCKNIQYFACRSAGANYFILVRLLHALKCEQARGWRACFPRKIFLN